MLARPESFLAVELEPEPVQPLAAFLQRHGLSDTVSTHYGVDQADSARLLDITRRELGTQPLDLVIDDASHELRPTTATFNVLFPLLRPDGIYLIEDWSWAHLDGLEMWPDKTPLTILIFELVMAASFHPEIIASVDVDRHRAAIRRGPAEFDAGNFAISELYGERGRRMLDSMLPERRR